VADATGGGYATAFPRVLRRFALFAIAFSVVSITTGIFVNYAYGLTSMGPAAVWLWPVAAVGQVLVVLVLAELAGHMPLAGANYQWTARLVGTRFGYTVGALGLLYGAVGLPGIALVGLAPLTATVLGLDAAASNSRLLFAMARDRLLPGSRLLARVNATTATPIPALVTSLVVCLVLLAYGTLDGAAFTILVGATALVPYLIYLLTLGGYLARRRRLAGTGEPGFSLGPAALPVAGLALVWLVVVVAALTLPDAFRAADYVVLGGLALTGLWYVAVLRRRLRDGAAGLPAPAEPAPAVGTLENS
jgi:amino acid transporter